MITISTFNFNLSPMSSLDVLHVRPNKPAMSRSEQAKALNISTNQLDLA